MRKSMAILLTAAVSASLLAGCGSSSQSSASAPADSTASSSTQKTETASEGAEKTDASYTIGIGQFAEHGSLDNCREGFIQGLAEAGIEEGKNLTILYSNAQADGGTASQIANTFAGKDVDLMCGIATPMAQAQYSLAMKTDIPVIFTAVTDPVAAELANADGTPVGEITGTSDKLPIEGQLQLIRQMQPDAKTIGILYTTSEPNSVSAVEEYQEKAGAYGFTIEALGVTSQAEVNQATDTLISKKVDCFTNLTDNNVVGVLPSILEKTNEAGIPVYGSEIEQVKLGCVASAGIEYVALGKQTGLMAAKILTGEAKAADMPYETITEYEIYVNPDAMAALKLEAAVENAIDVTAE